MDDEWETVYTLDDWYDGPRRGMADFQGVPHYFVSLFYDLLPHRQLHEFEIAAMPPIALETALELQSIWERFQAMNAANPIPFTTKQEWGALPQDRARRAELEAIMAAHRDMNLPRVFFVYGEFGEGCRTVRWQRSEQRLPRDPAMEEYFAAE